MTKRGAPFVIGHWSLVIVGHWVLVIGALLAQRARRRISRFDDRGHPARGNPSSLYGRESTQGVYVRDSAVAVEKFALAERLEQLKEWDKSADVYRRSSRTTPTASCRRRSTQDNKIYQYTSVAAAVQERLAKWPQEGWTCTAPRYEADAEALLDAAARATRRSCTASSRSTSSPTPPRRRAAADRPLPRGRRVPRRRVARRPAARLAPDARRRPPEGPVPHRARVPPRRRRRRGAKARLDELKKKFADATGTVRGAGGEARRVAGGRAEAHRRPTQRVRVERLLAASPAAARTARACRPSAPAFGARLFSVEMAESMRPLARRRAPPDRADERGGPQDAAR